MSTPTILQDPLGNTILLSLALCEQKGEATPADDFVDCATMVVEQPALILKLKDGTDNHFYYRAIAWNRTILIAASKIDGHFQAHQCIHNPTQEALGELYKKSEAIYAKGN